MFYLVNSSAPGRFQFNFRQVIFKLTLVNAGWDISYEIALRWMPLDLTADKSTVVQVMAWCRQATRNYLGQCWPRSMSPNGVTRPQWVDVEQYAISCWCRTPIVMAKHGGPVSIFQESPLAGEPISKQMSLPPFVFLEAIRHIRHFLIDKVFKTTLCIP